MRDGFLRDLMRLSQRIHGRADCRILARKRAPKTLSVSVSVIAYGSSSMEVVSVRVPRALKEEMSRLDLDWAEYLRAAIEEKVNAERMKQACKIMDDLREKTRGVKFNSVKVIREARNSR